MLKLYYSLQYSSKNVLKARVKAILGFLPLTIITTYEPFTPNHDE